MHAEGIHKMKVVEILLTLGHIAFTETLLNVLKSNTKKDRFKKM